MKVQFNVQLPGPLAQKVRADARRNNRTLDDVVCAIVGDFFKGWTVGERAKFYGHSEPKRKGRRLKPAERDAICTRKAA